MISLSPSGESFPLPCPEEYAVKFQRVEQLACKVRSDFYWETAFHSVQAGLPRPGRPTRSGWRGAGTTKALRLEAVESMVSAHIAEALQNRSIDRELWQA